MNQPVSLPPPPNPSEIYFGGPLSDQRAPTGSGYKLFWLVLVWIQTGLSAAAFAVGLLLLSTGLDDGGGEWSGLLAVVGGAVAVAAAIVLVWSVLMLVTAAKKPVVAAAMGGIEGLVVLMGQLTGLWDNGRFQPFALVLAVLAVGWIALCGTYKTWSAQPATS